MDDPCKVYDDPRPIRCIWQPTDHGGSWAPGDQISKIVAYREHGPGDFMPFFAVYDHDDRIVCRVPGWGVVVEYDDGGEPF
jgi:hypothetical protein